jgi:hypothetical protein
MVNQSKLQSYRRDPLWKFGVLVPQTHAQAIELDKKNNNTRWQEAADKGIAGNVPSGYKRIRCHMIYDVKHDGRHKARLVDGGHLTDPNIESVYSGVVSLQGIRLIVF